METRTSNPLLKNTIIALNKESTKSKAGVWKDVALKLSRPKQARVEVNLWEISKSAKKDDTVVVAGKVLGYGELSEPLTVAAFQFSESARKKILEGKGKAVSLEELMKSNPKGTGVRVLA